jgi:hypothetical protein
LPILLVYNRGISIAFTFWPQIKDIGTKNCSFTYIQTFERREVNCFVHLQYFMNENKQAFLWPIILPRGGRERGRGVDSRRWERCSYCGCQTSTDRQTDRHPPSRSDGGTGPRMACVCVSVCLFTWVTLDFGKYVSR